LLNFVKVVELLKKLGGELYFIVGGGDVNSEIRLTLEGSGGSSPAGDIFYMPPTFSGQKITEVYKKINEMEKNRLLEMIIKRKKDTRWPLAATAFGVLVFYCIIQATPQFRKI